MGMSAAPVRALQSIRARGVRPTLRIAARESRRVAVARGRLAAERRCDRLLGVETAGIVRLDELRHEDGSWDDARMYEPTAVPVPDEILGSLPADPARSLHECSEQNVAAWRRRHPDRDGEESVVHVAYVAPHHRAAFDAVPGLRPLAEGERWATWGP